MQEIIKKLAKALGFATLETRNRDALDFQDVSVWSLRKALEAAYEAGAKDMRARAANACESAAAYTTESERKQCAWGLASQIRLLPTQEDAR
jgi:hypothetical protein